MNCGYQDDISQEFGKIWESSSLISILSNLLGSLSK